jgi:hypothetical protein
MPAGLHKVPVVLDVGAGLRPIDWYKPERHICVEPYRPYCDVLEAAGFEVWQETAQWALTREDLPTIDTVYMLDVIEHLPKATGESMLRWAQGVAQCQVCIYTPYGFTEQTQDNWGLGGHYWQTHRSGWLPEEFPGWRIQYLRSNRKPHPQGFYAIWEVAGNE